jgi:hypothetical protein
MPRTSGDTIIHLVSPIILRYSLASSGIPRTFALPNRTEAGTEASEKEISLRPWFFKKAPYLCTPPESTGFTASKTDFIAATKVEK